MSSEPSAPLASRFGLSNMELAHAAQRLPNRAELYRQAMSDPAYSAPSMQAYLTKRIEECHAIRAAILAHLA